LKLDAERKKRKKIQYSLKFLKQFRLISRQAMVPLFLETLKTTEFHRKVSQISNLMIF